VGIREWEPPQPPERPMYDFMELEFEIPEPTPLIVTQFHVDQIGETIIRFNKPIFVPDIIKKLIRDKEELTEVIANSTIQSDSSQTQRRDLDVYFDDESIEFDIDDNKFAVFDIDEYDMFSYGDAEKLLYDIE
jgi:hypothetical protein